MTKQTKLMIATAAMTGLLAGAAGRAVASTQSPTCTSTGTAHLVSGKTLSNVTGQAGQRAGILLADADKHDCAGKNDCKGKGGCKTGDNGCKGKNSCKGKGGCKTDGSTALANAAGQNAGILLADGNKHDCAGKNDCKGKGGCKTGDNGCKGKNSCKGKGGCKTDGSTALGNLAGQRAGVLLADGGKHDCAGKNDCKGKGGCKTGDNGCKGKNSCKGKGGCKTDGSI